MDTTALTYMHFRYLLSIIRCQNVINSVLAILFALLNFPLPHFQCPWKSAVFCKAAASYTVHTGDWRWLLWLQPDKSWHDKASTDECLSHDSSSCCEVIISSFCGLRHIRLPSRSNRYKAWFASNRKKIFLTNSKCCLYKYTCYMSVNCYRPHTGLNIRNIFNCTQIERRRRKDRGASSTEGARVEAPRRWGMGKGCPSPHPTRGSGERRELPQWGLGQSPSRFRFWCILLLKSGIWWQRY